MSESNGLYQSVTRVAVYRAVPGGVELSALTDQGASCTLEIGFAAPDVVRFRLYRELPADPFPLVHLPQPAPEVQLSEANGQARLSGGGLTCEIDLDPFAWRLRDARGRLVWAEQRDDTNVRGSSNVPALGYWQNDPGAGPVVDAFRLWPEERLYGFGEKFFAHDKRGHRLVAWNLDAYGVETERAYKNIPFYLSSRGYGLLVNSTARVTFHAGEPAVSRASLLVEVEDAALDYFVLACGSLPGVLDRLHDLTGRAPVPPLWAFGLWMSRCYFHTRETAEAVADRLRELEIPCDVLVFDGYWVRDAHQCDLLWDEERFPDPAGMLAGLKARGFKSCVWEGPFVPSGTEMAEEAERAGYLLARPEGGTYWIDTGLVMASHNRENFRGQETAGSFDDLPPAPPAALVDFTNPQAVAWYQRKHADLLALGVDVFKTDFGEQVPEDAVSPASGLTGAKLHNLYAVLYNRAVFEATRAHHGRGLVWARSAGIGSQQYPVHWGGDPQTSFSSLAGSLRGGLSLGLSGVPFWGSDIGGFFGAKPTPRLYVRWAQLGLLSGVARCHGTTPREPWEYGPEALDIFRKYARLRYQLLPYLYSAAHHSSRTGLPLMRALVLGWPDDPAAQVIDSQYLLGTGLLVAPVLDDQDERSVYFPEGDWLDWWTREIYHGPAATLYPAPLDTLPLFIRRGAIVPLGPELRYSDEKPFDPLTLLVFPGPDSHFTYTDDVEVVEMACQARSGEIRVQVGASTKTFTVRLTGLRGAPAGVRANGADLPREAWTWVPGGDLTVAGLSAPFELLVSGSDL